MKIYFLGIAGAGVSALASMLKSQGHEVLGSDQDVFPPISTYLERQAIPYFNGFAAANVPADIDIAIIGASAKLGGAENPELAEIVRLGVPRFTFPEYLAKITQSRDNIVIAGSFGKSTLTAMIAFFLREAGRDPGYFIGAAPLDLETTGHWGKSPECVLEGDEYVISNEDRRSKFVLYHPSVTLISSLVHDHFNMFPTFESYVAPFRELIALTPKDGLLVCAHPYEKLREIAEGRKVVWYGLQRCPGYWADEVEIGEITRFKLVTPYGARIPLQTELLGLHNIENIVGAAALLLEKRLIDEQSLQRAARRFRGVARRLDKKTAASKIPCYEGFGSSYEKARSAIEAIQLHFPKRRLVVVFEPHTFSWRNEEALAWYDTVFEGVGEVFLLPPPSHGAATHAQLTQQDIAARIKHAPVAACANAAEVTNRLLAHTKPDDVILLLSSGPLGGLAESLPPLLDARFA